MALTSCTECNGTVSTQASSCPHCGAPSTAFAPTEAPAVPITQPATPASQPIAPAQLGMTDTPTANATNPDFQDFLSGLDADQKGHDALRSKSPNLTRSTRLHQRKKLPTGPQGLAHLAILFLSLIAIVWVLSAIGRAVGYRTHDGMFAIFVAIGFVSSFAFVFILCVYAGKGTAGVYKVQGLTIYLVIVFAIVDTEEGSVAIIGNMPVFGIPAFFRTLVHSPMLAISWGTFIVSLLLFATSGVLA